MLSGASSSVVKAGAGTRRTKLAESRGIMSAQAKMKTGSVELVDATKVKL